MNGFEPIKECIYQYTDAGQWGVQWDEEIIRCRDCKHYTDDEMEYYHYCGNWCEQVEPNGFCAWGEKKEN